MWWVVYTLISNSIWYLSGKYWQNQLTSDKDNTEIKSVTLFSETECTVHGYFIGDPKQIRVT